MKRQKSLLLTTGLVALTAMIGVTTLAAEPARPVSRTEAVLTALPKAAWIAESEGRRVVYIFFDPNCPSCAMLYRNLRTLIEPLELQVRWIPVALVNTTSPGKVAAILQAPNPRAAFHRNEERQGGIEEDFPTVETEQKLQAN